MKIINMPYIINLLLLLYFSPSTFAITYTYDNLDRLTTATYQNGDMLNYSYDQAGNVIKVALKTTTKVTGTVLDETKQPIVGATVQIGGSTTTTDSTGQFAFTDLADDTYQVIVSHNGYTTTPLTFIIDETHRNVTLQNIIFSKVKNYLVIASTGKNNIIIRDVPNNSVVKQFQTGTESNQISVTPVDFNNDKLDGIAVSVNKQLSIYENNLAQTVVTADTSFPLEQMSYISAMTDLEGQSEIVLVPQPTDTAYFYTSQGKSAITLPLSTQKENFTLAMADVDGDGDLETILGSQNSYQVTVDGTTFSVFSNSVFSNTRRGTRDSKRNDDDDKGKNTKITICHNGKNLDISENAWKAHEDHGDTKGACPPPPPKVDPPTGSTTTGSGTTTTTDTTPTPPTNATNKGVNVAAGDLDGDGKAEIVAAMAKEGSTVAIHHGDGSLISSFEAFDTMNGVIVSVGDVNNDGMADIVVGDVGGTAVKIFTVADGQATQLSMFNIESGTVASLTVAKGIVTPTSTDKTETTQPPTATETTTENPPITEETTEQTPVSPNSPVYAPMCQVSTDGIHTSCSGQGKTITDMTVDEYLSISNVKIGGNVVNHGLLSNIVVLLNAILTGGTLTGDIENNGLIVDIKFKGHKLKGGKLKNRITILADVSLRLGIVEDVTLDEGTHLSGGRLQGKIQGSPNKPALLENTEIADGTYLSNVIIGQGVRFLGRVHEDKVQRQ